MVPTEYTTPVNEVTLEKPSQKILIVEDEQLVRWSLSQALSKAGFLTTTVTTAEAAIESIKNDHYDLVITDFELKTRNGYEVASCVKMYSPDVPVILTSALCADDSQLRGNLQMIDVFVEKPYDLNELTKLVFLLLSYKNDSTTKDAG